MSHILQFKQVLFFKEYSLLKRAAIKTQLLAIRDSYLCVAIKICFSNNLQYKNIYDTSRKAGEEGQLDCTLLQLYCTWHSSTD